MGPNTVPAVFLSDSVSAWSGNDNRASSFKVSDELVNLYEANDLRGDVFYRRAAKSRSWLPGKYRTFATYNDPAQVSCTFSFRYAEIVLNRAEAYAMQGSDIAASNEIQKLRTKRLSSGSSQGVPTSNEALVQFIRDERRRELSFEGHRWFDLRRYAVNSKFPLPSTFTIKHPAYAYDSQTNSHNLIGNYVLNAVSQDASAWQVPIPNYAIEFNRGNLTNLIRPVRNVQPL